MDPTKIAVTDHEETDSGDNVPDHSVQELSYRTDQVVEKPIVGGVQETPNAAPVAAKGRLFLFKYVTMLVSGLIVLSLVTLAGYSLLDYWLGDVNKVSMWSEWVYRYQLYLAVSLVLFGGLHIWMHLLTGDVTSDDQLPSSRVFLAVFLTILALTALGSVTTLAYIAADMMLGTTNYSSKNLWQICLSALQVIVLATLLWWYFKQIRVRTLVWYAAAAGLMILVVTALLIMFPVLSRRDAVIDARTSGDLATISTSISEYARKNDKLPAALRDLKLDNAAASRLGLYEYEITQSPNLNSKIDSLYGIGGRRMPSSSGLLSYKLCAKFKKDTTGDKTTSPIVPLLSVSSEWTKHPSGRHCFDQTVYGNPEFIGSSESNKVKVDDIPEDTRYQ